MPAPRYGGEEHLLSTKGKTWPEAGTSGGVQRGHGQTELGHARKVGERREVGAAARRPKWTKRPGNRSG